MNRIIPSLLALLVLGLPACTNQLVQKEQFLQEAGFKAITPTTQAQITKVQALRQGHITRVTRKGKTLFVLSDAKRNLLLVGGNQQFERYQQILYTKKVDPAIEDRAYDKEFENAWGGWDGMLDPFFFGGPMMFY